MKLIKLKSYENTVKRQKLILEGSILDGETGRFKLVASEE